MNVVAHPRIELAAAATVNDPIASVGDTTSYADDAALIELRSASKYFVQHQHTARQHARIFGESIETATVRAVDAVDVAMVSGEIVGLMGESGCGKSTLARLAVGLTPLSRGERLWRGRPLDHRTPADARAQQLKAQMIYQDPGASLNPHSRVLDIVGEAPLAHRRISRKQQVEYVGLQLNRVGLDPTLMRQFPRQFSEGQRARIAIARALAVKPEFLACDETLANLDVSVQAQLLNLFIDLRSALNLTLLFISRDPGVIEHISDRVMVMALGRIVESGRTADIFARPHHPYTKAILGQAQRSTFGKRTFIALSGDTDSTAWPPSGCLFRSHCTYAMPICSEATPPLLEVAPGQHSACHLDSAAVRAPA